MKVKKLVALAMVALLGVFAFTGCTDSTGTGDTGAVAPADAGGFEEFPIGDDIVLGPLNVAGVYFQPVDMEPAKDVLPKSQSDMHIEADISAGSNELGYPVGSFVPNLTVTYEIDDENGKRVLEGAFMPMNADDGPHYGANINLGKAGKYKVRFIIESPVSQGYLIHTDEETGVSGKFWTTPLVAEWDFDYIPHEW